MSFGALQAMLPTSREPVKAMITGSSSARAVAPGCMAGYLWPPTARSTTGEEFFACRIPSGKRARLGFLALAFAPKLFAFGRVPRGACPLPASRGFGSVSSFRPLRTSQAAQPKNMLVQTNRQGRGCASGFGCLPTSPCCLLNRCELVLISRLFHLARPTCSVSLASGTTTVACPMMRTGFEWAPSFFGSAT